jgi:hypothetical protein
MDNKIPLPTDNIFKFYALFGLLLFVFSLASTIYINRSTNEQIIGLLLEIETLKDTSNLTNAQTLRQVLLERQLEIATSDKQFFRRALALLGALSTVGMAYGFRKWHQEVQPLADEAARIQLQLAKIQLANYQAESLRTP